MSGNVTKKTPSVKRFINKFALACTVFAASLGLGGLAHAEDSRTQAMLNAAHILNHLHAVVPERLPFIIEQLEQGKLARLAPSQPVWVLEIIDGTILYYQGEPTFKTKPVAQLVDDDGQRFGQKALQRAKGSRGGWLSLNLGGKTYNAYCAAKYPFVVCSLVP